MPGSVGLEVRGQVGLPVLEPDGHLHMLLNQVPCVLWATDRELRFTEGIGAGLLGLGLHPREANGLRLADYFGTEDPEFPPLAAHWAALEGRATSYHVEWSGRVFQSHVEPLRDAVGEIIGTLGIALDVTERRRAESRNAAFQKLGQLLNGSTTPEEAARVVLSVADELLGWDACWMELVNPDDRGRRMVVLMDVVNGQRTDLPPSSQTANPLVARVLTEGPQLFLRDEAALARAWQEGYFAFGDTARPSASIMCVPIYSVDRPIGALSIQSYTLDAYDEEDLRTLQALADYCAGALERTLAEAAQQELQQQLIQAQKMEAVGRLAGGVAHDFNNMLAVINGYADLLQQMVEPGHAVREGLSEIQRAGQRAAELTRQLLAFSRKQLLDPCIFDLNEVVRGTEKMLRRLIGEDVVLSTELDPALGQIRADPTQMDQVLMNVAVNARDAMPRGGKLILATRNVDVDEQAARKRADLRPGRYVRLSITDTGCGMSPEVLSHLFEPFFTTKAQGEGTGLGLATVYGIVRQSGGAIDVESTPGRGSTFHVYLPRVDAPAAALDSLAAPRLTPGSETVLVVEDEEMVRTLVATVLRTSGYTVLEARNGDDALRVLAAHPRPVHGMLTDVVMPGSMNGRDLATEVRRWRPEVKILFMSGYTDDAVLRHGIAEQDATFIQKPFTGADLTRKVAEHLRSRS